MKQPYLGIAVAIFIVLGVLSVPWIGTIIIGDITLAHSAYCTFNGGYSHHGDVSIGTFAYCVYPKENI